MVTLRLGEAADHEAAYRVWDAANTARRGGVSAPSEHHANVRARLVDPSRFLIVAEDAGEIVGISLGLQARDDDGRGEPLPGLCHV